MVRLRRWFVEFAFEVLKSERIFWKRSVRSDLLGVEMRIGKRVWRSLYVILSVYNLYITVTLGQTLKNR